MIQSKESSESVTATRNAARSSEFMVMLYGLACFPSFVCTFKHRFLWSTVFLHVFCTSKKSSESHPSLPWSQKHESMIVWCGHWRSLECFGWGVLAASGKMRVPQRSLALTWLLKFEVKKWNDTLDLVIFPLFLSNKPIRSFLNGPCFTFPIAMIAMGSQVAFMQRAERPAALQSLWWNAGVTAAWTFVHTVHWRRCCSDTVSTKCW